MDFGAITVGVKTSLEEKLDKVKGWGMTVWQASAPELKDEDLSRVKDLVAERGLAISALASGVPMCNPELKEKNLRIWDERIEMASMLGVEIMFSRTFKKPDGLSDEEAWRSCVEMAKVMTARCKDRGRIFAFETDSGNFIQSLGATSRLLDEVAMTEMAINFDPCNFYVGGGDDPLVVIDTLFDRFVHGHIKDGVRPEDDAPHEVAVGLGDLDYGEILGELHRRGYNGAMVIEHCTSFDEIEAAWNHVNSVCAKLGL